VEGRLRSVESLAEKSNTVGLVFLGESALPRLDVMTNGLVELANGSAIPMLLLDDSPMSTVSTDAILT
jgi:hypothetical protein